MFPVVPLMECIFNNLYGSLERVARNSWLTAALLKQGYYRLVVIGSINVERLFFLQILSPTAWLEKMKSH